MDSLYYGINIWKTIKTNHQNCRGLSCVTTKTILYYWQPKVQHPAELLHLLLEHQQIQNLLRNICQDLVSVKVSNFIYTKAFLLSLVNHCYSLCRAGNVLQPALCQRKETWNRCTTGKADVHLHLLSCKSVTDRNSPKLCTFENISSLSN